MASPTPGPPSHSRPDLRRRRFSRLIFPRWRHTWPPRASATLSQPSFRRRHLFGPIWWKPSALTPVSVVERRKRASRTMSEMSARLLFFSDRWILQLPPKSPADGINFPLIALIAPTLEYNDETLVGDWSLGMPIVGHVRASGVLTSRGKSASAPVEAWRKHIPPRNKMNAARVKSSRRTMEANECWERAMGEIQKGGFLPPHRSRSKQWGQRR